MNISRALLVLLALLAAGSAAADSAESVDTTVMSFNIRYGRADDGLDSWSYRHDKVCATITAHEPSIFGVQECLPEQAEVVRECFPGYEFSGVGRDDGHLKGEMCAIFTDRTRYEVLDSGVFWLSETPEVVGSVGWDAAMTRIASWVKLRDKKCLPEVLYVFNTHFDHVGVEARRQSALLLRERVAAIAGEHPAILMGDFNADAEGSPPQDALTGDQLRDSWSCASREQRQKGPGTFHGFTGETSRGRIDWILTTPGLPCLDAGIDRTAYDGRYPSDHYPVWAKLRQELRPELIADYAQYVDPFVGTGNMGHTYPGPSVPFGMVQPGPDTRHLQMFDATGEYNGEAYRYCSGYQFGDERIAGFSHTRFSGTGHSDLGDITLMPVMGEVPLGEDYSSAYRHETETAEPGYYAVRLDDPGIGVELTASTRVAMHRYTFEQEGPAQVILDMMANIYDYEGKNVWTFLRVENDSLVTGYRQTTGWARTRTVYFAMSFSEPFTSYGHQRLDETPYNGFYRRFDQEENFPEMAGREIRAHFDFEADTEEPLLVKVALSPVSTAGALGNLRAELPHWDFDRVRTDARQEWNRELGRVQVETMTEDQLSIFYTALYHTMLGPIVYEDVDGSYRGLDQNVHVSDGFTNYTVFSLWDTYRAQHPLLNLIQTERNTDMISSMLAHFDQSVHPMLPVWSHYANENWCMIGYHAVPVLADALVKGNDSIDIKRALDACVVTANVPYFDGVGEYREIGYVPDEVSGASVSMTLEMAYDDWCIARMAELAGDETLEAEFDRRAGSFRNVFDAELGFMRPRQRDGAWREDFDTMSTHGQGFIEGNAWNYSLYVPQDVPALVEMMGGPEAMGVHLDELFTMELDDEHIAHTEDITRDGILGNYVHGNEPGHHIPYLFNWTDRPWQTQAWVRHIMDTMYGTGVDGLCGNDDAGQMSAWYVFSALGFYPVCPGSDEYALGSPLVERAVLRLENGNMLEVRVENQSEENIYVQRVEVNGRVVDRLYLKHEELVGGGAIVFFMGGEPGG